MSICGASTDHGPCQRPPCKGKARCYVHGGAPGSGRPISRPEALKRHLGLIWESVQADPNLRELNSDIGLCLARERELLWRLDDGDSVDFRKAAFALLQEIKTAVHAGDGDGAAAGMAALERHLQHGVDRDGAWEALQENSVRKAKLTEQATTIETKAGNALSARGVIALLKNIFEIVKGECGEDAAYRVGLRFQETLADQLQPDITLHALPPAVPDGA